MLGRWARLAWFRCGSRIPVSLTLAAFLMFKLFRSDPSNVDRLIAGFPGPLYLQASAIKWWPVIAAGPALAGLFAYIAIFGHLKHGSAAFLALLGVSIGLLLIVFGRRGLKGSLRLDHNGFLAISARRKEYRWCEVKDFARYGLKSGDVLFDTATEPNLVGGAYWPGIDAPPRRDVPSTPKINSFSGVGDQSMPDTYGFSADDLARLMNGWRKLAVQR
jgi:hypothetical protein